MRNPRSALGKTGTDLPDRRWRHGTASGSRARAFLVLAALLLVSAEALSCQPGPRPTAAERHHAEWQRLWREARALDEAGELRGAVEAAEKMLDLEIDRLGRMDGGLAFPLQWLAARHEHLGDWESATAKRHWVLEIERRRDPESWRSRDARRMLRHLEFLEQLPTDTLQRLWQAEHSFEQGATLFGRGQYREAEQIVAEALEIRQEILGQEHWLTVECLQALGSIAWGLDETESALRLHSQALEIQVDELGRAHPKTISSENQVGVLQLRLGNIERARELFEGSLEKSREVLGPESAEVQRSLGNLGGLYSVLGDYRRAAQRIEEALEISRQNFGDRHQTTSGILKNLGSVYLRSGAFGSAEKAFTEAYEIRREVFGERHPFTAQSLGDLGELDRVQGRLERARERLSEGLEILRRSFGETHSATSECRHNLTLTLADLGQFESARTLLAENLAILRRGREDPGGENLATANGVLAAVLGEQGDYQQAETLLRQALRARQEHYGAQHPDTARSAVDLADNLTKQGDYEEAETLLSEALETLVDRLGKEHPASLEAFSLLGHVFLETGRPSAARDLFVQVSEPTAALFGDTHPRSLKVASNLAISELVLGHRQAGIARLKEARALAVETLGEFHPVTVMTLHNLTEGFRMHRQYHHAEPLSQDLVRIQRERFGRNHRYVASALFAASGLYLEMGDLSRAEVLILEAIEIFEVTLGPGHWHVGRGLVDLGGIYQRRNQLDRAEEHYEKGLRILDDALGEQHLFVAYALNDLAHLYVLKGEHFRALTTLKRSVEASRGSLGDEHPTTGKILANLGMVLWNLGDLEAARSSLEESLEIVATAVGYEHPDVAGVLSQLARFSFRNGEFDQAASLAGRSLEIQRVHLALSGAAQSERQQLLMLAKVRSDLDDWLSFAPLAGVPVARQYAQVLSWKGSVLASRPVPDRRGREVLEQTELQERHAQVSRQISTLAWRRLDTRPAGRWLEQLEELTDRKEALERELGREAHRASLPDPEVLRNALPEDVALVDFLIYRRIGAPGTLGIGDPSELGSGRERYLVAFVVRRDTEPRRVDLGSVAAIEADIERWRDTFSRASAGALRDRLWTPLEAYLKGTDTVLISPDGALGRIAWPALPGSTRDGFLIEEIAIGIVSTPRDLPDLLRAEPNRWDGSESTSLLLLGEVDYGATPRSSREPPEPPPPSAGWTRPEFPALRHTGEEIRAVQKLFESRFPHGRVLRLEGKEATEAAVGAHTPEFEWLHWATHGFFTPPRRTGEAMDERLGAESQVSLFSHEGLDGIHPGLSTGIALSDANGVAEGDEDDGLLTALELAAIPLENTELAVLSACETGLGPTVEGEGVLGLQRALQAGGARTSVVSLWNVDDRTTQRLMKHFYTNLWACGLSKLEALRQAQLRILETSRTGSTKLQRGIRPEGVGAVSLYDWAGFVLNGDWR